MPSEDAYRYLPPVRTCWGEQIHTGGLNLIGQAFVWQLRQGRTNFAAIVLRHHRQDERLADSWELQPSRKATLNQEGAERSSGERSSGGHELLPLRNLLSGN